ncbi:hypothetical protein L6164_009185 [Bauhinia variegata]|uniref:Uncharacterized protein n=1 Tax=Bauhinia variegata TaxID=167791 RepID=A0ACB9PI43_BAUVA|nr:hypothetical protein L6164_009185 [Bauhinia variegata]
MVSVHSSYTVVPSEATPNGKLYSLCEQIKLRAHAPQLFVYEPISNHNVSIQTLITSLGKALVTYYPFAGRLCWIGGARWVLDCNAKGAQILEASCQAKLEDFGDFVPTGVVEQLIPTVDYGPPIQEVPLLVVQLTRFRCGGLTIGIAFCRGVCDGTGSMRFISSWAKLARGEALDLSEMPIHDRTPLNSRKLNRAPRFDHSEFSPPPPWLGSSGSVDTKTGVAVLKLTKVQVNKLKQKASCDFSVNKNKARPYTSFEVVAGHLWRCVSKARHAGNGGQPTRLSTLANCRNRLKPPLPDGYAGNVAFPTVTHTCTFDEITYRPLGFAVWNIREALDRLTDEYVSSTLDYIETQKDMNTVRYNFHYPAPFVRKGEEFKGNPNLFVVSWMNFSFQGADFGWGKPVYFGPGFMDSEGKAFVMNNSNGDGLILAICLQASHMDEFKKLFYQDIDHVAFPTSRF